MKSLIQLFIPFFVLSAFILVSCDAPKQEQTTNSTDPNQKNIIIDVRTVEEWNTDGHADCTINIPLDQFESKMESLREYEKVTLVCRSGNRAGKAMNMLEEIGIKNVDNLGTWENVKCK
jgi:phage shock protein E